MYRCSNCNVPVVMVGEQVVRGCQCSENTPVAAEMAAHAKGMSQFCQDDAPPGSPYNEVLAEMEQGK